MIGSNILFYVPSETLSKSSASPRGRHRPASPAASASSSDQAGRSASRKILPP